MIIGAIKYLTVILALSAPALAQAATYQWRDDNGVTHFTDDGDNIPQRYLNRAREFSFAGEERETKSSAQPSAPAPLPSAISASSAGSFTDGAGGKKQLEYAERERELKSIKQALSDKKDRLGILRHKWTLAKGRTPTAKELKKFEKKRVKGEATYEDNPYFNKKPLSTPAPARAAYFKLLEEIGRDEEKISRLEKDLQGMAVGQGMSMGANAAGASE